MADCVSRFQLAAYTAGDLPAEEARDLEQHLESCPGCRAALAQLEERLDIYRARDTEHRQRLEQQLASLPATAPPSRVPGRTRWLLPAAAGLAAAALLLLLPVWSDRDDETAASVQYKGQMTLQVFAKRDHEQFRVTPGCDLQPGDALRFVLTTDAPGYATIFSLGEGGELSPFYPSTAPTTAPQPLRIEAAGSRELPGSIVLDDYLGREYLVALFSLDRFVRSRLHSRLRQLVLEQPAAEWQATTLGVRGRLQVLTVRKIRPESAP